MAEELLYGIPRDPSKRGFYAQNRIWLDPVADSGEMPGYDEDVGSDDPVD